jgi:hypothetical protein
MPYLPDGAKKIAAALSGSDPVALQMLQESSVPTGFLHPLCLAWVNRWLHSRAEAENGGARGEWAVRHLEAVARAVIRAMGSIQRQRFTKLRSLSSAPPP